MTKRQTIVACNECEFIGPADDLHGNKCPECGANVMEEMV
jgi:RNA polymerase subunit RPABC4/transcription elongation factor Spt4